MIRALKSLAAIVAALAGVAVIAAYLLASASLPRRSGRVPVDGLDAEVEIELDALAVPRIRGRSQTDAFRALGYLHAQERFFQMDLTRRRTAGELAALFGPRALGLDRSQRPFEFRTRARALAAELPQQHRSWLEAYTQGVNAGLDDLRARPPEYWVAGAAPAAWTVEDSLLVGFAIYTMLSNNESYERAQAVMAATLAPEVYRFLTPSASRYDRPLLADASDPTGGYSPLAVPSVAVLDLRRLETLEAPGSIVDPPMMGQAASNQWASNATRGARSQAMVANDPHLSFGLPNLFYRAELYWPGATVRGVSIPGFPGIMIGANDQIAWGVTVSYADQADWVALEIDPANPDRYRTPDGFEPLRITSDEIEIGDSVAHLETRHSRFGPVIAEDGLGRPLALKATWLAPGGLSLDLLELATADSVEAGVDIIRRWSGPALSWTVAGADGSIAWAMNGPIPNRVGYDGSSPASWADGSRGWDGYVEPPTQFGGDRDGVAFNANNRSVPLPDAERLSSMWMRPHRAQRIAELLAADARFDELDFFRMQLDTRSLAYDPIRDLILELVGENEPNLALATARRFASEWNGNADAASPAFPILQNYYRALLESVLAPLLAPAFSADPNFVYRWPLADEPLLRLIEQRPAHLVPPGYDDWPQFLRAILVDTLARMEASSAYELDTPWGVVNRLDAAHPLAGLPVVGRWLRMPAHVQAGSAVSIRVATPRRGAVFRMVVAPADPGSGILQMAGGQSGHFLSPNFLDLHADWISDVPTPFLAGPTESVVTLLPAQ